ncbi:MAG: T9SS type A sorting domain-containing protein, partial [Lentimicrobium sp.]|nr:T9SS type A sorting domain-containing protein [Lentimicrobium sp.]
GTYGFYSFEFSQDNGATYFVLSNIESAPGLNEILWIPNIIATDQAKVRISSYDNPSVFDESDATFSVINPAFYIYTPSEGYVFYHFDEIIIQWYTESNNPVSIDFSSDNGVSWAQIGAGITDQIFYYEAPEINSNFCKIRISDETNPDDFSIGKVFSILSPPEIMVLTPNGGEVWNYNEMNQVSWSGSNISSYVAIDISQNSGATWQNLGYAESSPSGGTTEFFTPQINSSNARIRISDPYYTFATDISDFDFQIVTPPFDIYTPSPGNFYFTNQTIDVSWYSYQLIETNIELSTDNGVTFETVLYNVAPANMNNVTINAPAIPSDNCIVKIVDSNNPASFSLSDVFSINNPPVLTLIQPIGGEVIDNDSQYTIQWTYSGAVSEYTYFNIDFSSDNGNNWENIGFLYYTGDENSFEWNTPDQTSDACLIRITDFFFPFVSSSSASVFSIKDIPTLEICMVSVDSVSGKNIIIWNKVESDLISSYVILKESNIANIYDEIGEVEATAPSIFIDENSNPRVNASRYKVTFRDSSGLLYGSESFHQTIHLSINQGVGNSWNLNWSPYLGFPVSSYNIYRGSADQGMELIGTVSGNFSSYTDLNAQPGDIYYMVEVLNPNNCNPDFNRSVNYSSSTSNIASSVVLGVASGLKTSGFSVYPNPASGFITVKPAEMVTDNVILSLISSSGLVIETRTIDKNSLNSGYKLNTDNLASGVYTLRFANRELNGSVRFIKL